MGSDDVVDIEDVPVAEAWARLEADPASVLIDVRTRAEWAFVGLSDLSSLGKQPVLVEWHSFPDNRVDPQFVTRLAGVLQQAGVGQNAELLFICRSGGRSKMAAQAMTAAGFSRCSNVADGFEGALDANRHRGSAAGWKAAGLPWTQG